MIDHDATRASQDDTGRFRVGAWMASWSGGRYWPLDPHVDDIRLDDIIHASANECRYGNHIREFYSVAEHAVIVSQYCQRFAYDRAISSGLGPDRAVHEGVKAGQCGLMHDASEAYLGDVPSPLKKQPEMAWYAALETRWMSAISEKFSLPWHKNISSLVHTVDMRLRMDEIEALTIDPDLWARHDKYTNIQPLGATICGLCPTEAAYVFQSRFDALFPNYRATNG